MQPGNLSVQPDRHLAILEAVRMAQPGDVIILAGKGHEDYQDVNGVKHHFDDYEEAQQRLRRINGINNQRQREAR